MLQKLQAYLRDTGQEMKRVSWPTLAELKESTVVVIVTVLVITLFIFIVDKAMDVTVKKLITLT